MVLHNGLLISLEGSLKIGTMVSVDGHFVFKFTTAPVALEIQADASMKLQGIGQFGMQGVFRIDADGLALYANVSIDSSFGGNLGLSFQANATLQLYIGSMPQKHSTSSLPLNRLS